MSTRSGVETTKFETMLRFAQMLSERDKPSEERQEVFEAARAEGISTLESMRARIWLEIASGNAPLVGEWLRDFEPGDYGDNCEVLAVSLHEVEHGEMGRGLMRLCLLREHIVRSTEAKSSRYLLPVIEKTIGDIEGRARESAGDVAERPEGEALEDHDAFPLFM